MGDKTFWMGHRCLGDSIGICAAAHIVFKRRGSKEAVRVSFWEPFRHVASLFDGVQWVPESEEDRLDVGADPGNDWPMYNGMSRFLRFMLPDDKFPSNEIIEFNRPKLDPRHIAIVTTGNKNGRINQSVLRQMVDEARAKGDYPLVLLGHKNNDPDIGLSTLDYRTDDRTGLVTFEHIQRAALLLGPHTGPMFFALGLGIPCWCEESKDPRDNNCLNFPNIRPRWFRRPQAVVCQPQQLLPKGTNLTLYCPLHVNEVQDIYMANCQARFFRRCVKELGSNIFPIMTIDSDKTGLFDRLFDGEGITLLDLRKRPSDGIVYPTQQVIGASPPSGLMMRITMDTQVVDFEKFKEVVGRFPPQSLAGWADTCDDIRKHLAGMGIVQKPGPYRFVQGNLILAGIDLWKSRYMSLPGSIKHYCDDSIFSYLVENLDDIRPTFLGDNDIFCRHNRTTDIRYLESLFPDFRVSECSKYESSNFVESMYSEKCSSPSDINEHLPLIRKYAADCEHITELGARWAVSTWALLMAKPKWLLSIDRSYHQNIEMVKMAAKDIGVNFDFLMANHLAVDPEPTDFLLVDTLHTYEQLKAELYLYSRFVRKFIVLHDTATFGIKDETYTESKQQGLRLAVMQFLSSNPNWHVLEDLQTNNGLMVLEREEKEIVTSGCHCRQASKLTNALFLYRFHSDSIDRRKIHFLHRFGRQVSLLDIPYRIVFISDNTPETVESVCKSMLQGTNFEFVSTKSKDLIGEMPANKIGAVNYYTFFQTSMREAETAANDTAIFFCEDDYSYQDDAFSKAIGFLQKHRKDFVSLYDHPDRYNGTDDYKRAPLELTWEAGHHWRTCISTCLTFASTLESLRLNEEVFLNPPNQLDDHSMWCETWKHGRSKLWGAVPGLASHRYGPHLDDGYAWED